MPETIYYVYEKANGNFAGSDITQINDETYGSTTVVPPDQPDPPQLRYDTQTNTWTWEALEAVSPLTLTSDVGAGEYVVLLGLAKSASILALDIQVSGVSL